MDTGDAQKRLINQPHGISLIRTVRNGPREYRNKGGSHLCAVCNHTDREVIEVELAARSPLGPLSKKYGMSRASLSRHRSGHMSKSFTVIRPALPPDATRVQRLEAQAARLEARAAEADRAGHTDQLTSISRELRITYSDIAKAKGESDGPPPVGINIQTSEEWQTIRRVVWEVLEPHPKLRTELAKRLLALDGKGGK